VSSSAVPFVQTASATKPVFLAAGVTITAIAVVQSLGILLSWLFLS
jgi:hypothetical protein